MKYEIWIRRLIDKLWQDRWELYLIQPKPPLETWYTEGIEPEAAAEKIKQNYKKPVRQGGRKLPKRVPKRAPGIPG